MKKNIRTIFKSIILMAMILALVGCNASPTQTTQIPPTDGKEMIDEGNTLLIPLFVKDRESGINYDTDIAQVQVTLTSDTVDVNTLTALDIRAFYDATACEVGKECKVQIQVEIINDAVNEETLTMTPNITETTVILTK